MGVLAKVDTEKPPILLNIGNNHPITVIELVLNIEQILARKADIEYLPMQLGDVSTTFADIEKIFNYCGFIPEVNLEVGLERFCAWFTKYTSSGYE